MLAYPYERFAVEVTFTPAMVAAYAAAAGDTNPVHHAPTFAAPTRYRRLIASGTHTTALLLGLTASHYLQHGAMVGLTTWKVSCNLLNLRKQFAEEFFRDIFVSH